MERIFSNSFRKSIAEASERRDYINAQKNGAAVEIAPSMEQRAAQLIAARTNFSTVEGSTLYLQRSAVKAPFVDAPLTSEAAIKAFAALSIKDCDEAFLSGHNLTRTLVHQHTRRGVLQSPFEAAAAVQNIIDKNNRFGVWDLETFGANNDGFGRNLGQRITDFSFSIVNGAPGSGSVSVEKTYGSIIGIDQNEYDRLSAVIDRYAGGKEISEAERVTLDRLALMGNEKTAIDWAAGDAGGRGVYRYKSFAGAEDVAGTKEEMRRGLKALLDVGNAQKKSMLPSGMYGWEEELYGGLSEIIHGDLTAAAHNGMGFDIENLNALLHSDGITPAFRKKVDALLGRRALNFKYNLDTLAVMRGAIGDRQKFYLNMFGGDTNKLNELNEFTRKHKKSMLAQEVFLEAQRIASGVKIQSVAHAAEQDTLGVASIVTSKYFAPGNEHSLILSGSGAVNILGDSSQAFYAASSLESNRNGLFVFVKDPLSGQYRTSDGISIGDGNVSKESFRQSGIKRRAVYVPIGTGEIQKGTPVYNAVASAAPSMDSSALTYITLHPYSNSNTPLANSEVTIVGSDSAIKKQLDQIFIHAGSINDNGELVMDNVSEKDKKALSRITVNTDGTVKSTPANAEDLVAESTYAFNNDAAARVARDKTASKDNKMLRYIRDMDEYAEKRIAEEYSHTADGKLVSNRDGKVRALEEVRELFRQEFRDNLYQRTQDLMHRAAAGQRIAANKAKWSYYDYFAWTPPGGNLTLYSNTVSNMRELELYVRKNQEIIEQSIAYAVKHSGTENLADPKAQAYYKYARDAVETHALALRNKGLTEEYRANKTSAGYINRGRIAAEMNDLFEVDINGFRASKKPGGNIVKFDLSASGLGVSSSIFQALGRPKAARKDIKEKETVRMLGEFQSFLEKKIGVAAGDLSIAPAKDSSDSAGLKILSMLRHARKENPTAGWITPTEQHDVVTPGINNNGLSKAGIHDILAAPPPTIRVAGRSFTPPEVDKKGRVRYSRTDSETHFIDDLAAEVNEKILFNTGISNDRDAFIRELKAYGYSERDASVMYQAQQVKRTESHKMLTGLFEKIYANGGSVGYNEKTGHVFMLGGGDSGVHELHLPRQTFENGAFYVRTGARGTRHIDPLILDTSARDDMPAFSVTSILGEASRSREYYGGRILYEKAQKGLLHEGVQVYLKRINSAWGAYSTALVGDQQDREMANSFFVGNMTKKMGALARTRALQQVAEGNSMAQQVLSEMLSRPNDCAKALHELGYEMEAAVLQNIEGFMQGVSENMDPTSRRFFNEIMPALSHVMSHGDKGFVRMTRDTGNALEFTHANQSGIESKLNRTAFYDTESAEFEELRRQGALPGAAIRSPYESARGAGKNLGYDIESTLIGNRVSVSTEDWRSIVAEGDKQGAFGVLGGHTHRLLSSLTTDEGAGAITSYLADAAMGHRFYEQRIHVADVGAANTKDGRAANYRAMLVGDLGAASTYIDKTVDASGRITNLRFVSNNGVFVKKGTALFDRPSYGEDTELVRAKQTGYLRSGVFRDGMRLSDDAVSDILNQKENLERINQAESPIEEAYRILQDTRGVSHDYFVEELGISGNVKYGDLSEKNMGRVLIAGLGMEDARVAKALTKFKATELIGMEVTPDFVRELMDYGKTKRAIEQTKFGLAVNAYREGQGLAALKGSEISDVLQSVGFGSVNDFGNALYKERHSVSDTLQEGLRALGILGENEFTFGIMNNFAGQWKHGAPTQIKSLVMALRSKGYANGQIAERLRAVIPGISYDAAGDALLYSGGQINLREFQSLAKSEIGETVKTVTGADGKPILGANGKPILVETAKTEYTQFQNLDELRASTDGTHAVHIDERVYSNMASHRYTASLLSRAEGEIRAAFGDELGESIYGKYIAGRHAGDLLNQSLANRFQAGIFYTGSEERVFDSFNSNFTRGEQRRAVKKLEQFGMTTTQIDATVKSMVGRGATRVSWDKVAAFHKAASYAMAQSFNRHGGADNAHSLDEMKRAGFRVIGIDDFMRDSVSALNSGEDSFNRFVSSINGEQLILDLRSEELGKKGAKQLYANESHRYLAIPFQGYEKTKPDGSKPSSNINAKIASFIRGFEDYSQNYTRLEEASDARTELLGDAKNALREVRAQISREATSKDGVIKAASVTHMTEGVGHMTAQGHVFLGNKLEHDAAGNIVDSGVSLDGEFGRLKAFGKSLSELATRNRMIDAGALSGNKLDLGYAILGREVQDIWYSNEMFQDIAGGDKKLADELRGQVGQYLDAGGATLTGDMRQPTQRNRSTGARLTYYSDAVGRDEALVQVREWLQMKGDFDSDKLAEMMLKSKATISWSDGRVVQTDQLDYATYQTLLKRSDVSVKLHDDVFRDAQGEILAGAIDYNPKADPRNPSLGGGALDVDRLLEESTWDGTHTIDYRRSYTHEEIVQQTANWKELERGFNSYAEKNKLNHKAGSNEYLLAMSAYADTLEDSAGAKEAMHFHAWHAAQISARNAESSKQAAGILNTQLYAWQRLGDYSGVMNAEETNLFRSGIAAAQEATLSGKNETGETDIRRVSRAQQLYRDAYSAMSTGKGIEKAADDLTNFYRGIFADRANKEFALQPGNEFGSGYQGSWWLERGGAKIEEEIRAVNEGKSAREIENLIVAEQAAQLQGHLVRSMSLKGTSLGALRLGVTAAGFDPDQEMTMFAQTAENSMQGRTADVINDLSKEYGVETNVIRETAAPSESAASKMAKNAEEFRREAQKNAKSAGEDTYSEVMQGAANGYKTVASGIRRVAGLFSRMGGASSLAVGIAGGILMSGYVSGPSRHADPPPAAAQAQTAAQDEQDAVRMQPMSLADSNVNVQRGGPKAGYVININAETSRGQDAAVAAINNAVSGMVPQNGSINLSISGEPSDQLNQLQINRMVANAIGVA